MHLLLISYAAVAISTAASADREGPWTRFAPAGMPVSMAMPHAPTYARQVTGSLVGDIETLVWESIRPDEQFSVSITELPRAALWFCSQQKIYRQAFDHLLSNKGGELTSVSTPRGHPTELEMRYTLQLNGRRSQGRARAAFVGRKLILVNTVAESSRAERFISSVVMQAPKT